MIGTGADGFPEVDRFRWWLDLDAMTICLCGELGVRCERSELPHGVRLSCPVCDDWTFFFWRSEVKPCPDAIGPETTNGSPASVQLSLL